MARSRMVNLHPPKFKPYPIPSGRDIQYIQKEGSTWFKGAVSTRRLVST